MGETSKQNSLWHVRLRPASIDDLEMILRWDEEDHLQDEEKYGDADYNEWNWEYELNRDVVEWRDILIAECRRRRGMEDHDASSLSSSSSSGVPVGLVQIIDPSREEFQYWADDGKNLEYKEEFCKPNYRAIDIWIGEPDYLGQGIGSTMMKLALRDYCFSDQNVTAVLIDPMAGHEDGIRFYQRKCGFEPVGIRHFGPDRCLVHKLERSRWLQLAT